jgi:N-acetylglucosaminyl-diphospho-decaprenol L-rhamnosyltransferase
MTAELSIVIVNWNGGELLRRCLESIRSHPPSVAFRVIVVDNASTDESLQSIRPLASTLPLELIENAHNPGFGRANNQAFAASDSPLFFLLNPDAELTEGALDRLIGTLRSRPRAAACGPRVVHADGSLQPTVWPNPLTPLHIVLSGLGLWRLLPRPVRGRFLFGDHWTCDRVTDVPMVSGAAVLVKREALEQAGGFDERLTLYAEDNEWCLRVRRAGWQVVFDPGATVMHHGSVSSIARWGDLGKLRVQTESFLSAQRLSLRPVHRIANVLTLTGVVWLRSSWRRLRGRRDEAACVLLPLYRADLRSREPRP